METYTHGLETSIHLGVTLSACLTEQQQEADSQIFTNKDISLKVVSLVQQKS